MSGQLLFIFTLSILLISASLHFVFRLGLFYLESDLETTRRFIPLTEGITELNRAEESIRRLMQDLNSFNREKYLSSIAHWYYALKV